MQDRFRFRIPMFTDKDSFIEFQYVELGDDIEVTLCGYNKEPQQCTGLKDKNGKLIYEGDIVSVKVEIQDFFGEDEYYSNNYKGEIIFEKGEIAIDVIDTTKHPILLYYHAKDCEVIGNIYENPELLKDGD